MNIEIKEMLEQDINNLIEEYEFFARSLGFNSGEDFEKSRFEAVNGMIKFGGSFTKKLGEALNLADYQNASLIYLAFKDIWNEHRKLYLKSQNNNDDN